ncbi:hypothetical protein DPMN_183153, partial [Dreissena polymorpha]
MIGRKRKPVRQVHLLAGRLLILKVLQFLLGDDLTYLHLLKEHNAVTPVDEFYRAFVMQDFNFRTKSLKLGNENTEDVRDTNSKKMSFSLFDVKRPKFLKDTCGCMDVAVIRHGKRCLIQFPFHYQDLLKNTTYLLLLITLLAASGKFRYAWYGFLNLLDAAYTCGFSCPECGSTPSTVMMDGVTLGLR